MCDELNAHQLDQTLRFTFNEKIDHQSNQIEKPYFVDFVGIKNSIAIIIAHICSAIKSMWPPNELCTFMMKKLDTKICKSSLYLQEKVYQQQSSSISVSSERFKFIYWMWCDNGCN